MQAPQVTSRKGTLTSFFSHTNAAFNVTVWYLSLGFVSLRTLNYVSILSFVRRLVAVYRLIGFHNAATCTSFYVVNVAIYSQQHTGEAAVLKESPIAMSAAQL